MTHRFVFVLLPLLLLLLAGCQNQEREKQLQQREAAVQQREQQVLLHENELALREQRQVRAAAAQDSLRQVPPPPPDSTRARSLTGTWTTRMSCIETDCPGSAIGDSKTEQWLISAEGGTVLVKATVGDQIVRVYSGAFKGTTLELTAQQLTDTQQPDAQITVQLQAVSEQRLEGRREINRSAPCRIVYALELLKEAQPSR